MAEENSTPTPPATPPTPPANNEDIDAEVADLLTDMLALLCNTDIGNIQVRPVCGDKSAMFVVDFTAEETVKSRYRGMVIGREGRTIMAMRQYLKAVGGAYRRYYDIDLVEDRARRRPPRA